MERRVKVALYGNTCNNFLAVASALRPAGIDAHLFIDSNAEFNQLPESEKPELRRGYPEWIHKGPYHSMTARLWPGASPLVRELANFDVVIVSGGGVRLAPFVDRPFVFYVTGWDLTVAPFPIRFFNRSPGIAAKAAALLGGFWQRRGIAAVNQVWTQPFSPFRIAAERLGIDQSRIVPRYFPIMLDTDLFRADPGACHLNDANIRRLVDHHGFIVFHPSRLMLDRAPRFDETGQWKGNDALIEGFARFVRAAPDARAALALIDRGSSRAVQQVRSLITRLGIEDNVVWLQCPHTYGFDRAELLPLYSVADVVADEFGIGWFGSVVIEGLSMEKPVLCHVDEAVMTQLYPWHPILDVRTPDQIAASLIDLWRDPDKRHRTGERGRQWAVEFHSIDRASARYVHQMQEAAELMHAGA
jgi:glycosyltransferase involved in cell wall biosynthesis